MAGGTLQTIITRPRRANDLLTRSNITEITFYVAQKSCAENAARSKASTIFLSVVKSKKRAKNLLTITYPMIPRRYGWVIRKSDV